MNSNIRILIIEDVAAHYEMLKKELGKAGIQFDSRCVETREDFLRELNDYMPDIILSDYNLPNFNGKAALKLAKMINPTIPFIIVTGSTNEETAIDCMKAGASDYVIKEHIAGIGPAVINALEMKLSRIQKEQAEEQLRQSEEQFRLISENVTDLIAVVDIEGKRIYSSSSYNDALGDTGEKDDRDLFEDTYPDDMGKLINTFKETVKTGIAQRVDYRFLLKDGGIRHIESQLSVIRNEKGDPVKVVVVSRDITDRKKVELELRQSFEKLQKTMEGTIHAMARILEMRDPYTAGHQRRVAELAAAIAGDMGFPKEQIDGITMAGVIHDIGKIYVPAEILSKPGGLNYIELMLIKTHPQIGYDILKTIEFPWPVAKIVLQHHERMNGSGYFKKLSGNDILIEARIIGVADVVEAMASHRPYRPALGIDMALEEIAKNRNVLYDGDVVDACLKLFNKKGFRFQ